ncbi:uncharacterized protein LOC126885467 [Diabrotica virgifera virgifera]|uniref:Uncharacterized protein n=1 Tax=Diabrotica virgifera virgifera TaxID=50390 RepID=A0ABM5KCT1_DIAVI|nr:uncharacterized protein LOC126885467 [Diabrotica virgifera virgifera]
MVPSGPKWLEQKRAAIYLVWHTFCSTTEEFRSSKIDLLINRLDVAETRSKRLNSEVRSIRKEIADLRRTLSGPNNLAVSLKTGTGVTSDEVSSVDGCSSTKKIKASFTEEDGYTIVFTDGACENNGKPIAKAGIGVWFRDGHPL